MIQRFVVIAVLLPIFVLSACQLDARRYRPVAAGQTEAFTPASVSSQVPTATASPTPSPTFTQTPTPTVTPSPTATPVPGERLSLAQRAYNNGDYETARQEFDTLLADARATPNEQRLGLHWRGRSELQLGDSTAAIASLTAFLQQYPSDELARAAQFNLGVAYEQSGQFEQAIQAYRGSVIPDDTINSYIYERIGDLAMSTGAYTDTIAAYRSGVDATDDVGFQVHLREGIAEAELLRGQPAAAIDQYEAILNVSKIGSYRAKILRLAGEANLADDDREAAYERFLEAVNLYPAAPDSYLALLELVDAEVEVDEFQRGLVDYYAGAYEPALAAFERYLNSAPSLVSPGSISPTTNLTITATISQTPAPGQVKPTPLPRAEEANWYTALSQRAVGQYYAAINSWRKFIDRYPHSPHWGEATLEIGKTYIDLDAIDQAKVTFRNFAAENTSHPLAGEALWRAARLELDGDLLAEAQTSLNELAKTYPGSDYADDALYWAGQAAFKLNDYQEAVAAWAKLANNYAESDLASPGSYWQARALQALDRNDEAKAVLSQLSHRRLDYYGLRAEELLTDRQARSVPLSLPAQTVIAREQAEAEAWLKEWLGLSDVAPITELSPEVRSDPAFRRGQALLDIGLRDEALLEFETVKDDWWNNSLAMYQLSLFFRERGLGRLSILTAARLLFLSPAGVPDDAPIFIQRLSYPIQFEDVIFAEAEKYDLDPALVLAIMRQESLFERSAHSRAGARGLMQIMPATGEYVVERAGFDRYDPGQLWLPYLNIRFGTWYINQQLGIFDGNQFAALAAYNAGPGNVLAWIQGADDLDIFVESIPFRESRLYVKSIYVNLAAYRRLYGISSETSP